MNPNFRRMPTDVNAIRRNYLANLALQISNIQKNWNANQIFQTTGVTPTEPSDPRSRTDIGADVEYMKVQLRQALASNITDWANANRVVDSLNDPDDVRTMLDMLPKMATDLMPAYKSCVPADVIIQWFETQSGLRARTALDGLDLSQRVGMETADNTSAIARSMATRSQVDDILDILGRGFGAGFVASFRSGASGNGLSIPSSAVRSYEQQARSFVASGDANEAPELLDSIASDSAAMAVSQDNDSMRALASSRSGIFSADEADLMLRSSPTRHWHQKFEKLTQNYIALLAT